MDKNANSADVRGLTRATQKAWKSLDYAMYLGIAAAAAAAAFVARLALVALGIVGSIEEYSICGQACIGLNAGVVA